jgi:hypothetical protein
MHYMLLIYGEESMWANLSPDQIATEMGAYMAYTQDLAKAGVLISGDELHPVATAKTISVSEGKQKVVDGPFAETKEALGGYYLLNVETIEDALAWAAKCPGARYGRIEVRPVVMR